MDALYSFPLIAQDLSREEYAVQVADSLQHLVDVVEDIFARINDRIDSNATRTRGVTERVATCRRKIDKLTDSNRSTKVCSGAKYPGVDCYKSYASVFDRDNGKDVVIFGRSAGSVSGKTTAAHRDNHHVHEKLEFYHVKPTSRNSHQWSTMDVQPSGLGDLPPTMEHITSLFVFNTRRYAYGSDYSSSKGDGRTRAAGKVAAVAESRSNDHMDAAPFSISNRDQAAATKKNAESYLYSPGTSEAPLMDLPLDLPHLSGVAEDMQFSLDNDLAVIAPKSASEPVSEFERLDNVAAPTSAAAPSPRRVSIVEIESSRKNTSHHPDAAEEAIVVAPPPAPPLPPPIAPLLDVIDARLETDTPARDSTKENITSKKKIQKNPANVSVDENRSNLMEAIRNAGGSGKAKLRSITNEEKKVITGGGGGGGDLMADLHAKLSMRRKGISGDKGKSGDGSILDVISAMIPPPVNKTDQSSNAEVSSTEDDWD